MGKSQFTPEVINKIIGYIKKEKHVVNIRKKRIYLVGSPSMKILAEMDEITASRIRILQKRGFKVFSQPTLFD